MLPLLLALACTVPAPDLARPSSADPTATDAATPPPARGPTEEKLYQQLYAGELGEAAHARGQRARLVVLLTVLELSPDQLRGLARLAEDVRAGAAAVAAEREALGERELAAFGPIYAALEARLAEPTPIGEEEAGEFAEKLAAARAEVYGAADPRASHYRRVQALLTSVRPWMATLSTTQRARLAESRFVLARRVGPFVNPGDYGDLVGTMWDGGDFGSLRATQRPDDESHLDIGGLWSVEKMDVGPDRTLDGFQLEALVLMTAMEAELPAAIAIRLGEPAAADGTAAAGAPSEGDGSAGSGTQGAGAAAPR